ncbi:hypothetical protein E2562_018127 [Oryza meyeriana var. granulata]|uniref:Uncharacterized protein n=1 Tax=Oryza meyeriana var. granulata TaxID=110450 RepID=A0A6G1C693_9ORYZ|nr:hypothetical protein E2562_018127 [Oryza meyeriana var. granulata]
MVMLSSAVGESLRSEENPNFTGLTFREFRRAGVADPPIASISQLAGGYTMSSRVMLLQHAFAVLLLLQAAGQNPAPNQPDMVRTTVRQAHLFNSEEWVN